MENPLLVSLWKHVQISRPAHGCLSSAIPVAYAGIAEVKGIAMTALETVKAIPRLSRQARQEL
jgi:hypothetical protein